MFKRISDHEGEERDRRRRDALAWQALHTDEHEAPEPERPVRLDEEAGTAVHELKKPPKAEG